MACFEYIYLVLIWNTCLKTLIGHCYSYWWKRPDNKSRLQYFLMFFLKTLLHLFPIYAWNISYFVALLLLLLSLLLVLLLLLLFLLLLLLFGLLEYESDASKYKFFISCKQGLPGISSMKFCVPFLIIPNAPITTGIIFVLSFHILVASISRTFYFESFWNTFNEMFWSEGTAMLNMSIMIIRSSWVLIIISGLFASIFLFVWTVKSHNMVTFFLLLLVLMYACTVSQCVVSHNVYTVSSVYILQLSRIVEGILRLQLLGILILCGW